VDARKEAREEDLVQREGQQLEHRYPPGEGLTDVLREKQLLGTRQDDRSRPPLVEEALKV